MPKFEKGQIPNPQGCPKGAHHIGRPPNVFREQLAKALVEAHDIDLIKAVISGVAFPRVINKDGEVVEIEATPKERLEAIKMGWEYLYSKSSEKFEVTGANGDPLPDVPPSTLAVLITALKGGATSNPGAQP